MYMYIFNPRRTCTRGLLQLSVCVSTPANLRTGTTTRLTEGIGSMSSTFVTIIKRRFFLKLVCSGVRSGISLPGTKPARVRHFIHVARFHILSVSRPYS